MNTDKSKAFLRISSLLLQYGPTPRLLTAEVILHLVFLFVEGVCLIDHVFYLLDSGSLGF